MPELPTCECVRGMPPYDRLTAIYQAAAELSGDTSLPDVSCVAGVPPFDRFAYIYAAFRVLAGDSTLPSQECIEGESFQNQVTEIYRAVLIYSGADESYLCARGLPGWQQWQLIYAALYESAGDQETLESPVCTSPTFDILSDIYCALLDQGCVTPELVSAVMGFDGQTFTLVFSEPVTSASLFTSTGFELSVQGDFAQITYVSGNGTTTITLLSDIAAAEGDVIFLSYFPGDVTSGDCPLAMIDSFGVTNETVAPSEGDILSAAIRADGWSVDLVQKGDTTAWTFDFDLGADNIPQAGTPYFDVVSEGYNSSGVLGTITRTVSLVQIVRLPYPNQLLLNRVYNGGTDETTTQIALSDYIYDDDKNGGAGTSGTNPKLNAVLGFCFSGGNQSAAVSGMSATNNSTVDYPKVIGQWASVTGVLTADRVTAAFPVAMSAAHAFGMACVKFDTTGQTSGATNTVMVSTQTATQRTASGNYSSEFKGTMAVTGFSTAELVTLRAQGYPLVGDSAAVLDTDNFTAAYEECRGYNKATLVFNSTPVYAYVDPTRGTDAGSAVSTVAAIAATTPFWSAGKAIQNGATVIYLMAGTHPGVRNYPNAPVSANEWRVFQPAPGETSSTVTFQLPGFSTDGAFFECTRLQIKDVKVQLGANNGCMNANGQPNAVRFTNCPFDANGFANGVTPVAYRPLAAYFENCTGLAVDTFGLYETNTNGSGIQFDGCTFAELNAGAGSCNAWYRVAACSGTGAVNFGERVNVSADKPIQDNAFFENNDWVSYNATTGPQLTLGIANAIARGVCIRGNVWEKLNASQPVMGLASDGSVVDVEQAIVENNTCAGGRWNICYNDVGTTARMRTNWGVKNNIVESMAIKSDTFGTPSGNRIGNWADLYGCGWSGNLSPHIVGIGASGSFKFEFMGLKSYQAPTTSAVGFVAFVDREAYDGISPGAGGGNYHLDPSSPAYALQWILTMPFDQEGSARAATDAAGAYAQ